MKSPEIEALLERMAGRTSALADNRCVNKPIGCGGPATEFKDALSAKEYSISGLCQKCQDIIWQSDGFGGEA